MKRKMLLVLALFAFIGACLVFAEGVLIKELYSCSYCLTQKKVDRTTRNLLEPKDKQTTKAPSNTGLCKSNPSKLSTAHNFVFRYATDN